MARAGGVRFLVLGYPRSRTTWLANLLTYGGSYCLHGVWHLAGRRIERLLEVMGALPYRAVGVADPMLYLDLISGREELPAGLRVVVVRRQRVEAAASLAAAADEQAPRPLPQEEEWEYPGMLEVPYAELDDLTVLEGIWDYCTGGELQFDRRRASMLRDWNVQDIRWLMEREVV